MKKRLVSIFGLLMLTALIFSSCQFQKQPIKAVLEFNETFVRCSLANTGTELNSGVAVADGTPLLFTAKNLPEGKVVGEWTINSKKVSSAKTYMCYFTLKTFGIGKEGKAKVDFNLTDAKELKLTFNTAKVKAVRIEYNYNIKRWVDVGAPLESGTKVKGGSYFRFYAINLDKGKIVDTWKQNGTVRADATESKFYPFKVDAAFADKDGNIDISYTEKLGKIKVKFDGTKINGIESGSQFVNGKEFDPGTDLTFVATPSPGYEVTNWTINERVFVQDKEDISNTFDYTVSAYDVKDGAVTIAFTEAKKQDGEKVTLKYDKDKIRCVKKSGDEVTNGTIRFYAKGTPKIREWYINGKKMNTFGNTSPYLYIDTDDAIDNVLEVTYDVYPQVALVFDGSGISVEFNGKLMPNGEKFDEDTSVTLKVESANSGRGLLVNGKPIVYTLYSWGTSYTIKNENAIDGKITLSLAPKKEDIKVTFDTAKLKVEKTYSYPLTELSNGAAVAAGTSLTLTAKLDAGYSVGKWFINGFYDTSLSGNVVTYSVSASDIDGGVNEINITFEPKKD